MLLLVRIPVLLLAALCAFAQESAQSSIPEALRVPTTQKLLFQAHGTGSQIYTCKAATDASYAWALKAPEAKLIGSDGKQVGRHFAGPTWEAQDGSRVVGKAAVSVDSPDAASIPWLRIDAIRHDGDGTMSQVIGIQRLNTKGGKAPAGGCDSAHAGAEAKVAYEADYLFYGLAKLSDR